MLRRVVAAAGVCLFVASAPNAWATPPRSPIVVKGDDSGVQTTVTAPGHGGTRTVSTSSRRSPARRVHCVFNDPGEGGQAFREDRNGVPGRYYYVDCYRGSTLVSTRLIWFRDATPPPGASPAEPASGTGIRTN